ncbi:MAG: YeeE/YedE family protein [Desulfuromonadales bacterium]|nr:YeeE/YedE family protein [Desulfuromonadales bacterium]MBN2793347.1 YeeE/YedE family protein [Desulfuromonadales bacterium]
MEQFIGLITGLLFGFLLQKGEVLRFEKQVGFMLLKDMTIIKFMFSAVLVGMVGIYAFHSAGIISLSIKATHVGAIIIGGLLFGIGWAIAGFCPGTSVGALAEGRIHAFWAILGMLVGAAIFAEVYPSLKTTVLTWGNYGKITLPQILGISPWPVVAVFIAVGLGMFYWFEKKGL